MQPSLDATNQNGVMMNSNIPSQPPMSNHFPTKQLNQTTAKEPLVNGEHLTGQHSISKLNEPLSNHLNSVMYTTLSQHVSNPNEAQNTFLQSNYNQVIPNSSDLKQNTGVSSAPISFGDQHSITSTNNAQENSFNTAQNPLNVANQPNNAFTPASSYGSKNEGYPLQLPLVIPASNIPNSIQPAQTSVSSYSQLTRNSLSQSNLSKTLGNNLIQSSLSENPIGQYTTPSQSISKSVSHSTSVTSVRENSSSYGNRVIQAPSSINNLIQSPLLSNNLTQSSIGNANLMEDLVGVKPPLSSSNDLTSTFNINSIASNNFSQPSSFKSTPQTPHTVNNFVQPAAPPLNSNPPLSNGRFLPPTSVTNSLPNSNIYQPSFSTSTNFTQPPLSYSSTVNPIQSSVSSNGSQYLGNVTQQPTPLNNFMQSSLARPPNPINAFNGGQSHFPTHNPGQPPLPPNNSLPLQQTSHFNATSPIQYSRKHPNAFSQAQHSLPSNNARPPPLSTSQFQPPISNNMPPLPNNNQYNSSNNFQIPPGSYNNHQVSSNNTPHGNYINASFPPQSNQQSFHQSLNSQFSSLSVNQGLNKMWGYEPHDLLNLRNILPSTKVEPPPIRLPQGISESMNCSPDLFRCTLTKIPETKSLLDKSRLPLGLLIHPFKDINQLKVIKNVIVRCKTCRTYINPFVQFLDSKIWKCNICFRSNEVHDQFLYDRNTELYGDPYRRPEVQSATVEYLATADYNVRDPPQPAMYLFLLDVSQIAAQSRYLYTVCEVLLNHLKSLPGDLRTSVGIITYDSAVHFYNLSEGQAQPSQMILTDIDDIFLPSPENILVNLNECYDMVVELLKQLPDKFKDALDSGCALGAALQAAYLLLKRTGGRVTVFQTCLPNMGPAALQPRENPNQRCNDEPPYMNPATDFFKKMALDCSLSQIAVDLFVLNSQYVDLATLSGISKFSSGCIHHIPLFSGKNMSHVYQLDRMFSRYLTRKIGFESVMRVRCTRGLAIHTFHGNFFVRSPDLLALPNVNPDAGFGIQIAIEENLSHIQYACFQAALLYTSSKGDRRIRVHTMCIPVVSNINDVLVGADVQCIVGLLAKMAVDRSLQHSLSDAREAYLNVVCDVLSTYKLTQTGHLTGSLLAPSSLKLLPLYILALLKHPAFRIGQSTRLDDRLFAMCEMKSQPLNSLMLSIYPELYPIHMLDQDATFEWNDIQVPSPQLLQLSAERLQSSGTYLMNTSDSIIILVRQGTSSQVCSALFGFHQISLMPETLYELPQLETPLSEKLHAFISYLNDDKAYMSPVKIMKDSSPDRLEFYDRLIEDKNGAGMSYYEFLQRVREQVK